MGTEWKRWVRCCGALFRHIVEFCPSGVNFTLVSLVVRTDSWNADKSCHSFTAHWFESDLSRGREAIACLRFVGDHDYTAFAFQLDGIKKEHYLLYAKKTKTSPHVIFGNLKTF